MAAVIIDMALFLQSVVLPLHAIVFCIFRYTECVWQHLHNTQKEQMSKQTQSVRQGFLTFPRGKGGLCMQWLIQTSNNIDQPEN